MAWQDWLAVLQSETAESPEAALGRLATRIDELLASLEAAEVADKEKEKEKASQALTRIGWRAAMLAVQPFLALDRITPLSLHNRWIKLRAALQQTIEPLEAAARSGSLLESLAVRPTLLAHRGDLEALLSGIHDEARQTRRFRGLLLLGPSLLASVAVVYLRAERPLQLEHIEVIAPAAAYSPITTTGDSLTPRQDYLVDYMREFSKHYFGHPSAFETLYFDRTEDGKKTQRRSLQHKVTLRNASHGKVSYLSSVEAVVEVVGEASFPWTRLTVTPHVTAQLTEPPDHRSLVINSDGIGPALDLQWSVKADSGLELAKDERPILHRGQQRPLRELLPGVGSRAVQTAVLSPPMYWRLPNRPADPVSPHFFEVKSVAPETLKKGCTPFAGDYGFYEEVSSVTRLHDLTTTAYDEPWTLQARYVSLKGELANVRLSGRLNPNELFYRRTERLLNYDPRCGPARESEADGIADYGADPIENLVLLFRQDKDLAQPKGVDLLTARLGLDLLSAPVGRRIAATAALDGFLNPQGILAVYLTLNMPSRARYQVTVLVNGEAVTHYDFAGLVPEQLSFDREGQSAAVARLRKVFAVVPPQ